MQSMDGALRADGSVACETVIGQLFIWMIFAGIY